MDKISVIVPIYNMEERLAECLTTLISQKTYNKFKIEIILVDDGSTDSSPLICDYYKSKYTSLITVIHKKNKGVSEARNVGIQYASSDYIAFVDPDDYVTPYYLYNLFTSLKSTNSDISCCGFLETWTGKSINRSYKSSLNGLEILTSNEALTRLFYQKGLDFAVWGKLIKSKLFDNVLFPSGRRYEDVFVTYNLISNSKRVALFKNQDYIYWQRNDGMLNASFNKSKLDVIPAFNTLYNSVNRDHPELINAVTCRYFAGISNVYFQIPNEIKEKQILWKYMTSVRGKVLLDRNVPLKIKAGALCTFLGQKLMKKIYRKTQRRGKILR